MMSNRLTDILFQLIKSLEKSEKRHFKLYIKRSSSNENLKIIQLFDGIDKLKEYDEKLLMKKVPAIDKSQLSNLKAHLYKQILASLRLLKSASSLDLQLNEQFDYAHILYKKGLFIQSLKILEKAKQLARSNQKFSFLMQAISLEKRIETLHITRSMRAKADSLSAEAIEVSSHIDVVSRLSNLALQLYSWYITYGHARNKEDEEGVKKFMRDNLPKGSVIGSSFYERLYLYQSYAWYAFIRQDFLLYYRYAQKWVDLYEEEPLMKLVETGHYIKGLHNLLNAHYDLRNYQKLAITLQKLEEFSQTERVLENDNFRVQSYVYITQAKINLHFLQGTFKEGLLLVPEIEEKLEEYSLFIDSHRILVLNYKIACLYFGSGDFNSCIDYLHKIIHDPVDLRYDIQCYARILHLLAHYELGNFEIIEHLTKSVYRFMAKMKNLTVIEEEMFRFLKSTFFFTRHKVRTELANFLANTKHLQYSRFEMRSLVYLDIITWVESKVLNKTVGEIMREKYKGSKVRKYR